MQSFIKDPEENHGIVLMSIEPLSKLGFVEFFKIQKKIVKKKMNLSKSPALYILKGRYFMGVSSIHLRDVHVDVSSQANELVSTDCLEMEFIDFKEERAPFLNARTLAMIAKGSHSNTPCPEVTEMPPNMEQSSLSDLLALRDKV